MYTDYLNNGGYEKIMPGCSDPDRNIEAEACFADADGDGVRELLLRIKDGQASADALLGIRGDTVVILGQADCAGGSMGGDFLCFKYDRGAKKHVFVYESYSQAGIWANSSETTVFDVSRTDTPVTVNGINGEYQIVYNADYTLKKIYISEARYSERIGQIKSETDLFKTVDDGICAFWQNERYISEEDYDRLIANLADPTDPAYTFRAVTMQNPIPD